MSNRLFTDDTGQLVVDAIRQQTGVIARTGRRSAFEPYSYDDVQSIVRLGLAPYMFSVGDIIDVSRETALAASLGEHTGITAVSVNEDTFIAAMGETGTKEYEFIFDGSAWKLAETVVMLATLGITVTGAAAEGDTILIVETASTIHMVVMDFIEDGETAIGNIKLHDKTKKYGMILQSLYTLYGLQFDNTEAVFVNTGDSAMSAGTYNLTLGDNYDTTYGGGATYQFTLTQPLPAGGQIVWPWAYNAMASAAKISTYASGSSLTPIESNVTVTAGDEGTSLGTVLIAAQPASGLNSIHRMRYGSNRWGTSAMRQHLNSAAKAGSVWAPKTIFDRTPSWVSSTAGFMHGLDPEFVKICAEVELITALSTAAADTTSSEGAAGTGYETTVDKFFLPSRPEVFAGGDNASDKGTPWEYYKANSDYGSANAGADSNRIKTNSAGSAQYWWLRSPNVGNGGNVRYVHPSGNINYDSANNSHGVAPACVVA